MLSRDRISRLAALSLFLSAVELFIPRFLPFFRLGLSNIPILMALDLNPLSFLALCVIKGIGTSYTAGNLFSVFAIISLLQSICSGLVMYGTARVFKSGISRYGVSLFGALTSTLVQIALAALYAGRGTLAFLPIMLILSFPAAILTAYLSEKIPEPDAKIPEMSGEKESRLAIILFILSSAAMMMTTEIILLLPSLALAFILQYLTGRKIKLLPHLSMLLFMVLSSLLVPHGKVLFSIFSYPVTEGSLADGISKGLRLSGGVALSQAFSTMRTPGTGIIGKSISIFTMLLSSFRNTTGSLWSRFLEALHSDNTQNNRKEQVNIPIFTLISLSVIIIALAITDCVFF